MDNLELIERKLGRRLRQADRGRFARLNEMPLDLIEQARALGSTLLAHSLIAYYTSPDNHQFLKRFVEDVVLGATAPATWRRGRVLVPSLSLDDQLRMSREEILRPLGGEFHARIVPEPAAWRAAVAWVGAPAKPEADADYRTTVPEKTASLAWHPLNPVSDQTVALRRWIAGRLARVVTATRPLDPTMAFTDSALRLPPPDTWSPDAVAAADALRREVRELGPAREDIPGFRGPDDWYRTPTSHGQER